MVRKLVKWSDKEDDLIRLKYPVDGSIKLSKLIDRNPHQIVDRAYRLGIKMIEIKKTLFCENCNIPIDPYCHRKEKLCRSCSSKKCYKKRSIFTNHCGKLFSESDIEMIKLYYPNSRKVRVLNKIRRSWASISHKAHRLKIKRNYRFQDDSIKNGINNWKLNNPVYNKDILKKMSKSMKESYTLGRKLSGIALKSSLGLTCKENHPNWKDGISFEPYDKNWDNKFKKLIRKRDHNKCMICNRKGECIHHIDYDKLNSTYKNCVTLCSSCHGKTNYNRVYWLNFFGIKEERIKELIKTKCVF